MNFSIPRWLLALLILIPGLLVAQGVTLITKVTVSAAKERLPVSVSVELAQNSSVQKVTLKYRSFGESDYKELEMLLAGRTATVSLPAEVVRPPYVEYFVQVDLDGGKREFYPVVESQPGVPNDRGPEATPAQINVTPENPKDREAVLLSPEPGETVAVEDLAITVSLFNASDAVNPSATKIYLDGIDVSGDAVRFDDLITYSPKNFTRPLNLGSHFLKIELRDTLGNLYHSVESSFGLSTAAAIEEVKARLQANGSGQLEYRNENVSSGATTYIRGDVRTDGSYSFANFGANVHLDNQDKPERQPQNRFSLYADAKYLRVEVGDAFPRFPSLIVSGKRVRGVSGNLTLGFFNLDATFGQTERAIEGTLAAADTTYPDTASVNSRPKNSVNRGSFFRYNIYTPGTYTRSFYAIRPSFGNGENFQLGFTYMKAKDDMGSINYGILPQENLVAGTDLTIAFDDQHFKWETQASLGILNTDISKGGFTDATFDSLRQSTRGATDSVSKNKDYDDLKKLSDLASNVITVNENLTPINPIATGLPGVSMESIVSLNYFNNFLRAQFFRRGAAYKSFGNEYLQTDIQGIQVSDFLRLFSNRVFLSVSVEQKNDNTADTKEVTTSYSNINTSLSLNLGAQMPTFQIGFGQFGRNADVDNTTRNVLVNRADSASVKKSADEKTTRYFLGTSYDFVAGLRHTLAMSFNLSDRVDNTFYKKNQNNYFIQGSVVSYFKIPFQTTVSVVYSKNHSEAMSFYGGGDPAHLKNTDSLLVGTDFNYTIVSLGGLYRMMEDNLRLTGVFTPAFGALKRTSFQAGADYTYLRHNFTLQFDFIRNTDQSDDTILSFIYRLNF